MAELWPWLRLIFRQRSRLLAGGALMFATLLAGVGLLALSGWFITATALTGLLLAAGVSAQLNIYAPGGGIRFFALARTVSRYVERLYNHDTVLRLLADIRVVFFRGLADAPLITRKHRRPADWLNRLTRDIDTLDTLYLRLIAPPALALTGLALLALVLATVAPTMLWSLLPLASLPPMLYGLSRLTLATGQRQGFEEEALRGKLVDTIEGMAELQAAQRWGDETNRLLSLVTSLDRSKLTVERHTAVANGLTVLAVQLAVLIALWSGLGLWREGDLSGPAALLFTLAVLGLGEAFTGLPPAFAQLGATQGAATRLNGETSTSHTPPASTSMAKAPLSLEGLTVIRQGVALFDPLTVTLQPGQRLAVTGRSGSGKSSLLDGLAGLEDHLSGTLAWRTQPFTPSASPGWLNEVSYLRQNTHFFSDSLRANLALAKPRASDEELMALLNAVGLSRLVAELPHGLDSWIGDQGRLLSGGERRRLGLARAVLRPGWLLLLDEPFTGVDPETRALIGKQIEPWLAGRTCIFAGHSTDALPAADQHIQLN